ncbi:MAG: methyltransferase domain-containing protein [Chloroflexota bacterium]
MRFDYQETTEDLQTRIDIHSRYGNRDIDQWMIELLRPAKGSRILDVGCGSGKQLEAFHRYLDGEVELTGGDINAELLKQATARKVDLGGDWEIRTLDFNQRFPMADGSYDLVSCCFALYYAQDIPRTIGEMNRVLATGGRLFTTGPMPENKQLFYEVIREATGKPIPPMPGSSRYGSEILQTIRGRFGKVEVHIFENQLAFESVGPFLDYTRASLSEDRKLWATFFENKEDFERIMGQIETVARERLAREGNLTMTKVVGGFVATK